MNTNTQRPGKRAFTLTELLTVIAIIGILAAILIPVVGTVRDSAKTAKCQSNLREIGNLLWLYADDHDGQVMLNRTYPWSIELMQGGYLESQELAFCPSVPPDMSGGAQLTDIWRRPDGVNQAYAYSSYGLRSDPPGSNDRTGLPGTVTYVNFAGVQDHSQVLIFADTSVSSSYVESTGQPWQAYRFGADIAWSSIHMRHGRRANGLFLDGHVEGMDESDLRSNYEQYPGTSVYYMEGNGPTKRL